MAKRLGIIGGGQLGMMITEAAKNLSEYISEIIVLDPTENCPAVQAGAKQIVGGVVGVEKEKVNGAIKELTVEGFFTLRDQFQKMGI